VNYSYGATRRRCVSEQQKAESVTVKHIKTMIKNNIKYNTDDDVIVSMELHTPNET